MDTRMVSGTNADVANTAKGPRHAGVLPRFATAFVFKPMLVGTLAYRGGDLLAWSGPLPSAELAAELRKVFVDGRRNVFDPIWASKVEVKLLGDWRSILQGAEIQRMGGLLALMPTLEHFPEMTLREVKKALHMPVTEVLGLLARIEATYWSDNDWSVSNPGVASESARPAVHECENTDTAEWRGQVRAVIQKTWVLQLQANDLRFGTLHGTSNNSLSEWLATQLEHNNLSPACLAMANALLAADSADWITELREVLNAALIDVFRHPKSRGVKLERHISMFMMRYGGMEGYSLQQVGDAFEVTRERVRKICEEILIAIRMRPAAMPALAKVMAKAAAITPLPLDAANEQLAPLLGAGVGISAAIDFAQAVGRDTPAKASALYSRAGSGRTAIPVLQAEDEKSIWIELAYTLARRDCSAVGCSSLVRVMGLLALEGVTVTRKALLSVLELLPDYRLLDGANGWFCLSGEACLVAARMRKLLSVTKGSVHLDTLMVALTSDDRLLMEGPTGISLPPKHIMRSMLATWPWLTCNRYNRFTAKQEISCTDQLAPMEARALEVLTRFDGIATRTDLLEVLVNEDGYSNPALSTLLATSPVLCRVEHSIYRHNGLALSSQGLAKARSRRSQQSTLPGASRQNLDPSLVDTSRPFNLRLSQAASQKKSSRRTIHLPKAYANLIDGDFRHSRGLWSNISAQRGLLFVGLAGVAEAAGFKPGDEFDLRIDLSNGTYDICAPAIICN